MRTRLMPEPDGGRSSTARTPKTSLRRGARLPPTRTNSCGGVLSMRRLRVADRATCPRTSVTITCQRCRPSPTGAGAVSRVVCVVPAGLPVEQHLVGHAVPEVQRRGPGERGQARAPPVRRRRPGRRARARGRRRRPRVACPRPPDPCMYAIAESPTRSVETARPPRGMASAGRAAGSDSLLSPPNGGATGSAGSSSSSRAWTSAGRSEARSGEPGGDAVGVLGERRVGLPEHAAGRAEADRRRRRRRCGSRRPAPSRRAPRRRRCPRRRRSRRRAARRRSPLAGAPSIAAGSSKAEPRRRRATARTVVPPAPSSIAWRKTTQA